MESASTEAKGQHLPRIAVITLVQNRDFPAAWSAVHNLDPQLSDSRVRFVLINDSIERGIEDRLKNRPHTEVLVPGRNVGVARGRNLLIQRAREWGADLIVTLDDDLLAPSEYLELVSSAMDANEKIAIATPVLLDYHKVAERIHSPDEVRAIETGDTRSRAHTSTQAEILSAWRGLDETAGFEAVHHMGIRDWERHYFAPLGPTARKIGAAIAEVVDASSTDLSDRSPTEIREDPTLVESIRSGRNGAPILIDSAPGGTTIYRASVFANVGLLEAAFSPFGYEDADICIRAKKEGLTAGLFPSLPLLHDLQSRYKQRDPLVAASTRAKARALLIRRFSWDRSTAATRVFESFVLGTLEGAMYEYAGGGSLAGVFAYVAGYSADCSHAWKRPSGDSTLQLTIDLLMSGLDVPQSIWRGVRPKRA